MGGECQREGADCERRAQGVGFCDSSTGTYGWQVWRNRKGRGYETAFPTARVNNRTGNIGTGFTEEETDFALCFRCVVSYCHYYFHCVEAGLKTVIFKYPFSYL